MCLKLYMVKCNKKRVKFVILSGRGINLGVALLVGPIMVATFLIVILREFSCVFENL